MDLLLIDVPSYTHRHKSTKVGQTNRKKEVEGESFPKTMNVCSKKYHEKILCEGGWTFAKEVESIERKTNKKKITVCKTKFYKALAPTESNEVIEMTLQQQMGDMIDMIRALNLSADQMIRSIQIISFSFFQAGLAYCGLMAYMHYGFTTIDKPIRQTPDSSWWRGLF